MHFPSPARHQSLCDGARDVFTMGNFSSLLPLVRVLISIKISKNPFTIAHQKHFAIFGKFHFLCLISHKQLSIEIQ